MIKCTCADGIGNMLRKMYNLYIFVVTMVDGDDGSAIWWEWSSKHEKQWPKLNETKRRDVKKSAFALLLCISSSPSFYCCLFGLSFVSSLLRYVCCLRFIIYFCYFYSRWIVRIGEVREKCNVVRRVKWLPLRSTFFLRQMKMASSTGSKQKSHATHLMECIRAWVTVWWRLYFS